MEAKAAEAWAGLRALHEGAAPSIALLAKAGRVTAAAVARRAENEGWEAPHADAVRERQRRLQQQITRLDAQVDRLMADAEEAGTGLDKSRIDLLSTLLRSVEKLRELVPTERKEDTVKERDARVANILQKIHERIQTLAQQLAPGGGPQPGRR
ncbi:hypothetical protein [Tianweitania sediminis]|uniref:Uncharacterized protein n=1 Tax=Tianweitania sediminis TaxID=1502156 RepID=A0A8J7RKG6_9HYPH|nr:hypothetical protein [Tianweitania sediminis]MBP0438891.1 hypothetical protein [Tianweitania sediminis]